MSRALRNGSKTWLTLVAIALAVAFVTPPAHADEYERDRAGHPIRVLAYLLHPVGVMFDYLIFRPAHWLGHQQPFQTIFGHEEH